VFQEKHDGERRPIRRGGEAKASVEGLNKEGLLSGLPMNLVNDVLSLNVHRLLMDGEAMGERYVAFDLLELNDEDLRQQPYKERLKRLEQLLEGKDFSGIECVYTARTTEEKRRLFESLKKHKAEGVVSKNSDAAYAPGRPASGGSQEKFKFTETCSVRVSAQHKTKRSVSIEGLEDDGITVVALGNVTIPANAEIPKVGAIVNVSYLYLYRGGSLFQAVYEKERDDQTLPDRLSQFKVKSEEAYRADAAEDVGAAVEEAPSPTRKKAKP
jgi:bifunctional non-homologous end joining protein LigD